MVCVCVYTNTGLNIWFKNLRSVTISVLMYNRWKLQHVSLFLNELTINSQLSEKYQLRVRSKKRKTERTKNQNKTAITGINELEEQQLAHVSGVF